MFAWNLCTHKNDDCMGVKHDDENTVNYCEKKKSIEIESFAWHHYPDSLNGLPKRSSAICVSFIKLIAILTGFI